MVSPSILCTAVYVYSLPSQGKSKCRMKSMSYIRSAYCNSGYQLEKISQARSRNYSCKNKLHATEVFCGLMNINKAYRRPGTLSFHDDFEDANDLSEWFNLIVDSNDAA